MTFKVQRRTETETEKKKRKLKKKLKKYQENCKLFTKCTKSRKKVKP